MDPYSLPYEQFQEYLRSRGQAMPPTPAAKPPERPYAWQGPPAPEQPPQISEDVLRQIEAMGPISRTDPNRSRLSGPAIGEVPASSTMGSYGPPFQNRGASQRSLAGPAIGEPPWPPRPEPMPEPMPEPLAAAPMEEAPAAPPVATEPPEEKQTVEWLLPGDDDHLARSSRLDAIRSIAEGLGNFRPLSGAMIRSGVEPEGPYVAESTRNRMAEEADTIHPREARVISQGMDMEVPPGMRSSVMGKYLPMIGQSRAREDALVARAGQRMTTEKRLRDKALGAAAGQITGRKDMIELKAEEDAAKGLLRAMHSTNGQEQKIAMAKLIKSMEGGRPTDRDRSYYINRWGAAQTVEDFFNRAVNGTLSPGMEKQMLEVAQHQLESVAERRQQRIEGWAASQEGLHGEDVTKEDLIRRAGGSGSQSPIQQPSGIRPKVRRFSDGKVYSVSEEQALKIIRADEGEMLGNGV